MEASIGSAYTDFSQGRGNINEQMSNITVPLASPFLMWK